jgi:hypothetical protein
MPTEDFQAAVASGKYFVFEIGGHTTIVDHEFSHLLTKTKPYIDTHGYVKVKGRVGLHRLILNAPRGVSVDHINGNKLDNRLSNLRLCTQAENTRNRRKHKNNTSGYTGVYFNQQGQKFYAQIHRGRKKIHLGCFTNAIEAARVYDAKAREMFGQFARLNLPND